MEQSPKKKKKTVLEERSNLKNSFLLSQRGISFPPPKKVLCSKCKKNEVVVKFVIAQQNWSKKNNWGFWTENEKYKDQEWCGQCLRQTFYDKKTYWQAVQNSKRRSLFRVYLARKEI